MNKEAYKKLIKEKFKLEDYQVDEVYDTIKHLITEEDGKRFIKEDLVIHESEESAYNWFKSESNTKEWFESDGMKKLFNTTIKRNHIGLSVREIFLSEYENFYGTSYSNLYITHWW